MPGSSCSSLSVFTLVVTYGFRAAVRRGLQYVCERRLWYREFESANLSHWLGDALHPVSQSFEFSVVAIWRIALSCEQSVHFSLYQISLHAVLKLRERVHCGSVSSPMGGLSRSCVAPTVCCSVGESVASVLCGTNGSLKMMCRSFWHQQVAECGRDGWVGPFGTNGSLQLIYCYGPMDCWDVGL